MKGFVKNPTTWLWLALALAALPHSLFLDHEVTRRVALGGVVAVCLACHRPTGVTPVFTVLALLGLGLVRALGGRAPWYGFYETGWLATLAAVWLMASGRPLSWRSLAWGAVGLGLTSAVGGRLTDAGGLGLITAAPLDGLLAQPNATAHAAALGAVGGLMLAARQRGLERWAGLLGAVALALALPGQQSKAAWLCLGAGGLVLGVLAIPRRWRWPVGVTGAVGALALVWVVAQGAAVQESQSLKERRWMAVNTLFLIKDRPLAGHGPGQFPATNLAISPQVTARFEALQPHRVGVALTPHSEPLHLAHDWGFPALVLVAGVLWARRRWWRGREPLVAALAVLALLDFPLHLAPLALLLVLATATHEPGQRATDLPTPPPTPLAWGLWGVLAFALALWVTGVGVVERRVYLGEKNGDYAAFTQARWLGLHHPYGAKRAGMLLLSPWGDQLIPHAPTRWRRSVKWLSLAAAQGRGTASTLNNLGVALKRTGRLQDARLVLTRATALEPAYCLAHENLAGVALLLGDKQTAEAEAIAHRACLARQRG